jgi:Uma2 family endonuclease
MPAIVLEDQAVIPAWVQDHASFVRWTLSDEYPERGRFAFLGDRVWVDLQMEAEDHNDLKMVIGAVLLLLVKSRDLGRYYGDRMLLSHPPTGLSTEPDGMFVSNETQESGRVALRGGRPGRAKGVIVEGTPDMVLEVVSPSSVRKDTVELFDRYWQADIPEYWLVDARGEEPRFTLYTHGPDGYRAIRPSGGWRKSAVFGLAVRLGRTVDRLGRPSYVLETR